MITYNKKAHHYGIRLLSSVLETQKMKEKKLTLNSLVSAVKIQTPKTNSCMEWLENGSILL